MSAQAAETQTQPIESQKPPHSVFVMRRIGALLLATSIPLAGVAVHDRLTEDDASPSPQDNPTSDKATYQETNVGNSIDEKLAELGLEHSEGSEKSEVSPELQRELKENTVIIRGHDNNGNPVEGNGLIVNLKGSDGQPDQQLVVSAAHIPDYDKSNGSKPIRERLGDTGVAQANIVPYLKYPFTVGIPGQREVRVVSAAVNTDPNIDSDLVVIRTNVPIDSTNGVEIPTDLSTVYDDEKAPSSEVFISAIVNGEQVYAHGTNRISGVYLFTTQQRSDLIAVKGDACDSGWSGAAVADADGIEVGKVVHEVWDPENPEHAGHIEEFKSLGMDIPEGSKVCQLIDGTPDLQALISTATTKG